VRADAGLARRSFRLNEAWQRRGDGAVATPEIDARLAGVEKRGGRVVVHSLSGKERNHYFANRGGQSFDDLSGLAGLDHPADGRGWVLFDYDRDGWQDLAVVNANEPMLNLYRNTMAAAGLAGGVVAVRLVGGNDSPGVAALASRDGYGAVVVADLGDLQLTREHRCGDGYAAQHSAVMMLGIGRREGIRKLTVRWPSGRVSELAEVAEGSLVTCWEEPGQSPDGRGFARETWRVAR
jgi:hypothetical protein